MGGRGSRTRAGQIKVEDAVVAPFPPKFGCNSQGILLATF